MSLFDKAVAAMTPPETDEQRAEARRAARDMSSPGDWLSTILDHHVQLEDCFAEVKAGGDAAARKAACKQLAVLLTGHAIAEESAIYPAMASNDEKGEAEMAYNEQAMVKMQMAELDKLDPMSQDFIDKLEHIRGAVQHHMYEEEGNWFPDLLRSAAPADQEHFAAHYNEAYRRFVGQDAMAPA